MFSFAWIFLFFIIKKYYLCIVYAMIFFFFFFFLEVIQVLWLVELKEVVNWLLVLLLSF